MESEVKRQRLAALEAAAAGAGARGARGGRGGRGGAGRLRGGGDRGGAGGRSGGGGGRGGHLAGRKRGREAGGGLPAAAPVRSGGPAGGRGTGAGEVAETFSCAVEAEGALYTALDATRLSASARECLGPAHPQGPAAGLEALLHGLMGTTSKAFDRQLAVESKVRRKFLLLERPRKSVSIYKAGAQARKAGSLTGNLSADRLRRKGLRDPCWVEKPSDGEAGEAGSPGATKERRHLPLSHAQTLNALWREYASKEMGAGGTLKEKLSSLSWLGSILKVCASSVPSRARLEGFVVQETAKTFVFLVSDDPGGGGAETRGNLVRVLKEGCTFSCEMPGTGGGVVTLHGDDLCN